MQRQGVAPPPPAAPVPTRPGAASDPVMPAQPGAAAAARPAAAGAAPAASGASRWLGPVAGIAAGLGLAALMSHLGLSEAFGSLLLIVLLVAGGAIVVRMLMRNGMAPARAAGGSAGTFSGAQRASAATPVARVEPTWGGGNAASAARALPAGFDPGPFLEQARRQFRRLQAAYDAGDRAALAEVTTPAMFRDIARDLETRGTHVPTEVAALDADVVDVATEGRDYVASVRFTGALREDGATEAKPFVEVWNLVKPIDGSSGWLLAGIQQVEESAA
jgi:predicted lipid-binding transport protein (Tim44 family)